MPRLLNWENLSPLLSGGQSITAFSLLTSIFLPENSLDKQFGSASQWHIVPAAWLGCFGQSVPADFRQVIAFDLSSFSVRFSLA